jgi:hypothetical protein
LIRRALRSAEPFGPKVKNIMQISCLAAFRQVAAFPIAANGDFREARKGRMKKQEEEVAKDLQNKSVNKRSQG